MLNDVTNKALKTALKSGAALGMVFMAAGAAYAQPADSGTVEKVTVTGSRIPSKNLTSNSPVATISGQSFQESAATNVEDVLNGMPQFVADIGATTNNGGGGAAFINLRGMGTERTLVLVNGRRYVPGTIAGSVDVNAIPAIMIDRVEVVTGGASAVYGSDALAGVVNFILKDDFEGAAARVEYSASDNQADAENVSASYLLGASNEDKTANVTLYGSYTNQKPVMRSARPISFSDLASPTSAWGRIDAFNGVNPAFVTQMDTLFAGYGIPAASRPTISPYTVGLNNDGTLWGSTNGGPPGPTKFPNTNRKDDAAFQIGCDNGSYTCLQNISNENFLIVPTTRYGLGGTGHVDLAEGLTAFGEITFMNWTNSNALAANPITGIRVPVTAAGIAGTDLATLLATRTDPLETFTFRRRFAELGPRTETRENFAYSVTGGLRGDIPSINGSWEVFASYQRNDVYANQAGLVDQVKLADALGSPEIGGVTYAANAVNSAHGDLPCASGNAACVPIDIMSLGSISGAAAAYISASSQYNSKLTQEMTGGSMNGDLFGLALPWATVAQFSLGAEYRKSELDQHPDSNLIPQDPLSPGSCLTPALNCIQQLTGSQDVYEVFGELRVPLLTDVDFVKYFGLEGGYRKSDYDTVGITDTYKIGAEWEVNDTFRFRGMYQRAVRAPTVFDLFGPSAQDFPQVTEDDDYCSTSPTAVYGPPVGARAVLCAAQGAGPAFTSTATQWQAFNLSNPAIQPEVGDTYTYGVVIKGDDWLPNFVASIDYYDIAVEGLINTPSPTDLAAACVANPILANPACAAFTRDTSTGEVQSVNLLLTNIGGIQTHGVDLSASYKVELEDVGLPTGFGRLGFDLFVNKLIDFEVTTFPGVTPTADLTGTTGNPSLSSNTGNTYPEWKLNLRTTYSIDDLDFLVQWRRLSSVIDFNPDDTAPVETTGVYNYIDVRLGWQATDWLNMYAGVSNLTDKDPPFLNSAFNANTDGSTYDVVGRAYSFGVTTQF